MDIAGSVYLAIPNGNATYYAMCTDKGCLLQAYPLLIWRKLGWQKIEESGYEYFVEQ